MFALCFRYVQVCLGLGVGLLYGVFVAGWVWDCKVFMMVSFRWV